MIRISNDSQVDSYQISTRLLMREALKKGYELNYFPGSSDTTGGIVRAVKDSQELFFKSTCTLETNSLGVFSAYNKVLTHSMLTGYKVSTPEIMVITDQSGDELDTILKTHKKLVVKPVAMDHGDGITVGVTDKAALSSAIVYAREKSGASDVIVQQYVSGKEYRFLVVDGSVVAVGHRRSPSVIGDGTSTTQELIEEKNSDPRRAAGYTAELTLVDLADVIHHRGSDFMSSIPAKNEVVTLLDTSNLSRGGEAVDFTSVASTALKKMARDAAAACFLSVAGIDIITDDISSENTANSYVIEVNATPGIRMHQFPSEGEPIDVARLLFSYIETTSRPVSKPLKVLGKAEKVSLPEMHLGKIPARIDTGATKSSLWASDIRETKEGLDFQLFDKGHELFTGERITVKEYSKRAISSSMGHVEVRYLIKTPVVINQRRINASITLANRSKQVYPMLIGRNILRNKFVVDVMRGNVSGEQERKNRHTLNEKTGEKS